jgi:hypothetical protein
MLPSHVFIGGIFGIYPMNNKLKKMLLIDGREVFELPATF